MMNEKITLNIKGTGLEVTTSIKEYIEKKVISLERFMPVGAHGNLYVEVGMPSHHHRHGEVFETDIKFDFSGNSLYAKSNKDDLYTSIEDAFSELIREVKNIKDRKISTWRRGARLLKRLLRR